MMEQKKVTESERKILKYIENDEFYIVTGCSRRTNCEIRKRGSVGTVQFFRETTFLKLKDERLIGDDNKITPFGQTAAIKGYY